MSEDHQNPAGDGAAAPAPAPKPTLNPRPAGPKVTTGGLGQTIGNMKDDLQWHGGEPRAARPKPEEGDTPKTKGGGLLGAVGAGVGKVVGEVAGAVKEGVDNLEDFVKNTATSLPALKKPVFEWPALHKAEPFPAGGRLPTDLTEVLANHNNALGASK